MAEVVFSGVVKPDGGLSMKCKSRHFDLTMDEPLELGGEDKGMTPFEGFLNILGACKGIVCKSFIVGRELKVEEMRIEVDGEVDPDGFTGMNPNAKMGFTALKTRYYFKTEEDDETIASLIKAVEETCPIKDTIVNNPIMTEEIHRL